MKTPRDILFERHRGVVPKLDAIRHNAVAQASRLSPSEELEESKTGWKPVLRLLWCELIFPSRRVWAGLAAVWILIIAANVSLYSHSPAAVARSSPTPELILAWRQQQWLLSDLLGPNEPRAAAPPKRFSPPPSSQRRFEMLMTQQRTRARSISNSLGGHMPAGTTRTL